MGDPRKDTVVSSAKASFCSLGISEGGNMMNRVSHKSTRQASE